MHGENSTYKELFYKLSKADVQKYSFDNVLFFNLVYDEVSMLLGAFCYEFLSNY